MSAGSDGATAPAAHSSRPFRAGSIAGYGDVLWLLDVDRPILVRRAPTGSCSAYPVPGPTRRSGIVGWLPRRLRADDSGCWVVGLDGTAHCDQRGLVRVVDPAPVRASALSRGILAAAVSAGGTSTVTLRGPTHDSATVTVAGEIVSICAADGGFVVLVRDAPYRWGSGSGPRGSSCARIGFDGSLSWGDPWPRGCGPADRVGLIDVGLPMVASRHGHSAVLGEDLLPTLPVPFGSEFGPWPTHGGPWFVTGLRRRYTYYRLDRHLARPDTWAVAPGFPRSLAVLDEPGQLWISTFEGLFVSGPGALGQTGEIEVDEAAPLPVPNLPVTPSAEVGDPEVHAYRECARLIAENAGEGLLDARPFGHYPHTEVIVLFALRGLPGATCAARLRLFDRNGAPALWHSAPTVMEHLVVGIQESGGVERLRRTEPGWNGWIWV